jgi:hypothetical protein
MILPFNLLFPRINSAIADTMSYIDNAAINSIATASERGNGQLKNIAESLRSIDNSLKVIAYYYHQQNKEMQRKEDQDLYFELQQEAGPRIE